MDIIQFQNKLKEIQTLAMNNGKKVQASLVEKFFEEDGMDQAKMQKVYDFLEIQGIHIEGYEKKKTVQKEVAQNAAVTAEESSKKERVPLTAEEEEYLKEYLENFENTGNVSRNRLLHDLHDGKNYAKENLVRSYQSEVIKAAKELNTEEVFFGDLVQEGNMGLLMALENAEGKEDIHKWLCDEIRSTIRLFIEDMTQQKKEDDILVEKVRNLEVKVKELTEDEDVKYSVEELAVFLDMDLDEMEAVLRLTGDDK